MATQQTRQPRWGWQGPTTCQHLPDRPAEPTPCGAPATWIVRWRSPREPDRRLKRLTCDRHLGTTVERLAIGGLERGRAISVNVYPYTEGTANAEHHLL